MTSRTLEAFLYIAQMLMSVLEPTSRHPLGGTLEMKSHKLSGDCPKRREINIHTLKTEHANSNHSFVRRRRYYSGALQNNTAVVCYSRNGEDYS